MSEDIDAFQGILSNRSLVLLTAHGAFWIVATVEARSQQFGIIVACKNSLLQKVM